MLLVILKNSIFPIFLRGLGVIASFLLNIFIANRLGAEDIGLFYQVMSVVLIFSAISRLGIDTYVLREFSNRNNNECYEKRSIYKNSLTLILVSSIVLSCALFFLSEHLAVSWFKDEHLIKLFVVSSLIIPFYSLLMFYSELMKSNENSVFSIFFQFVSVSIFLIILIYIYPLDITVHDLIRFYLVSVVVSLAILFFIWRKKFDMNYDSVAKERVSYTIILKNSKNFFLIYMLTVVINNVDIVILGNLISSYEIGVFMIAFKIAVTLSVIQVGFNSYLSPKFVQAKGDSLKDLFYFSTILMALLGLVLSFFVVLLSKDILSLFGSEFTAASDLLLYLVLVQFVNLATGSAGLMMMLTGHEKIVVNVVFISLIVKVFFGYILVNLYGVIGIAYASLFSSIMQNIYFLYYVKNRVLVCPAL